MFAPKRSKEEEKYCGINIGHATPLGNDHRLTKTATNKYACNKVDYRWVLQAFNVFLQRLIPKFRVTFIDRVDLATWLYAHVAVN